GARGWRREPVLDRRALRAGFSRRSGAAGRGVARRRAFAAALVSARSARGLGPGRTRPAGSLRDSLRVDRRGARALHRRARGLARGSDLVARAFDWNTVGVGPLERVDEHIRRYGLIEPRGKVLCLVSGGP